MSFDLSITISVIIGLAAVVSPILTSLINNHHQKELKEIELDHDYYEKTILYKQSVFEDYIRTAGRCIAVSDTNALQDYREAYFLASIYAPDELRTLMQIANDQIEDKKFSLANRTFEDIIPKLSCYMSQLKE